MKDDINAIIELCNEVLNGDTFLDDGVIREILEYAREVKSEL